MTGFQQKVAECLKQLHDAVVEGQFGSGDEFDYDAFTQYMDSTNDALDDIAFEY